MPEKYAVSSVHPVAVSRVHLVLRDEDEQPMAGRPYKLSIQGAPEISGTTDSNGTLHEMVKAEASEAQLLLEANEQWPFEATLDLTLTALPPATDIGGAQARLNALGYACGHSGKLDEATKAALRELQLLHALDATGALDAKTAAALDKAWLPQSEV